MLQQKNQSQQGPKLGSRNPTHCVYKCACANVVRYINRKATDLTRFNKIAI